MQFIQTISIIFTILFGLVFGSFLNVCIFRIPRGESIVFGRSHCMSCGKTILSRDLVPVVSFLWLRGRCRNCGAKISSRYPSIELLNALLWLAAFFEFSFSAKGIAAMAFISGLIVISFIDIDTKLIPNGLVIYLLCVGVLTCVFDAGTPVFERLLGVVAAGAPLLLILLVSRGGMGGGDVKFAAAAGLFLGWRLSLLSLFFAFITGATFGLVYLFAAHKDRKTQIPFAPFLAIGMTLSLLFGDRLIAVYTAAFHI